MRQRLVVGASRVLSQWTPSRRCYDVQSSTPPFSLDFADTDVVANHRTHARTHAASQGTIPFMIVLCWIRHMKHLAPFSTFANIATLITVMTVIGFAVSTVYDVGQSRRLAATQSRSLAATQSRSHRDASYTDSITHAHIGMLRG